MPINVSNNFVWGINGHPVTSVDYFNGSLNQQVEFLREHQLSHYRFDIVTTQLGIIENPIRRSRFEELLVQFQQNNIEVVPVLKMREYLDDYTITIGEAFSRGKSQGKGFSNLYSQYVNFYTIGNEEDLFIQITEPGMNPSDYDYNKFLVLASYYKGMIEGIKEEDPNSKIIIDGTGWLRWGYYILLDQANVDYDIIGYHWYSWMGSILNTNQGNYNVLQTLDGLFDKPIWITEVNQDKGTYTYSEETQSQWIYQYINEMNNQTNVEGFFVYELFDQPTLTNPNSGWGGPTESKFGIIKWASEDLHPIPDYNQYLYKIASKTYKFEIEEAKYGYEDYIFSLYNSLCYRNPLPNESGFDYWVNRLKNQQNQSLINDEFYRDGGLRNFIKRQYDELLDNSNVPESDISYWLNQMQNNGLTRENLIKSFCSSNQFWTQSGSSNQGFIMRLYLKLHNDSNPNMNDILYWTNLLNNGTPKFSVVHDIMRSPRYLKNSIKAIFSDILNREPTSIELNSYYNQMLNNQINQEALIKNKLLSQEYWDNAIINGYERRRPEFDF